MKIRKEKDISHNTTIMESPIRTDYFNSNQDTSRIQTTQSNYSNNKIN
jgi:hypothetical protein